jgi:hypothetical protein
MATTSLVFGLCSILIPLLAVPGFILGVVSLRRIKTIPSLCGRGRSIAGIITSLVLGPLGFAAVVVFIAGGSNQLSMPRVQSTVRSLLQSDVQQLSGAKTSIQAYCPNSEPRQDGKVFACTVDVGDPTQQYTTTVREVDNRGDFIVEAPRQSQSIGGSTGSSTNSVGVPPSFPAASAPPSQSTQLTGPPTNGEDAVIGVDAAGHQLTLQIGTANVNYPTCTQFRIQSPSGALTSLSELSPGAFVTVDIDASVPCVDQMKLLTTPTPPQCSSSGLPGTADVTWEGFNETAHSVLYRPSGPDESIVADRWCGNPVVVGPNHSATTLSKIPVGSQVQLLTSSDAGWVTGVTEIP